MINPTRAILGLGQGLAVIDHESVWRRLEDLNDLFVAGDMSEGEKILAGELKGYMMERVTSNHHINVIQKRKGLGTTKANEISYDLLVRHNQRLRGLIQAKSAIDQSNYH